MNIKYVKYYFFNPKRYFSIQNNHLKEDVLKQLKESSSNRVKLAAFDIDGIPRGKFIYKEKFINSVLKNGLGFCSVIFGWDSADVLYDSTKQVGWHTGYSDFLAFVDLNTFRKVPWENNVPFFILDFQEHKTGKVLPICPRNLLKNILQTIKKDGFNSLVGAEYEFFNFRETPNSLKEKKYIDPEHLTPGMFGYSLLRTSQNKDYFQALFDQMIQFGIPIEAIHTETGPGVYEAAILYSEALEAADRAALFKMAAKDIGYMYGIMPSFMAKPSSKLPGCGGHLHINLVDNQGNNIFYDPNDTNFMSQIFKHFLAGQMYCLPEIMPMFAPTVNSYKRLVEGYWAPITPTWGIENRTVSFRVIPGGKSTRVEVRISGADMNPYLAISAAIASGFYGIKKKLPLKEMIVGNAYKKDENKNDQERLPRNLWEAAQKMNQSEIARELFGNEFVEHFVATREWEWRQFHNEVTNWEIQRYFEII